MSGVDDKQPGQLPASPSPFPISVRVYQYLKAKLGKTIQDENTKKDVAQDIESYIGINQHIEAQVNAPTSRIMKGPMYWNGRTTIRCNEHLKHLAEASSSIAPDHAAIKILEKVLSFWTSANSLKQLERFADERQPGLLQKPLPDGSNLFDSRVNPDRSDDLYNEWFLRRL
jgi:hypothetical protein